MKKNTSADRPTDDDATPTGPSPATRAALAALLKADRGVSATRRARVLAAFDAPEGDAGRAAGMVPASVAAKRADVYLSTLLDWTDAGKVSSRRVGDRLTLVNLEEVLAYAALHPRRRRGTSSPTP